jgi:hypothetical protein
MSQEIMMLRWKTLRLLITAVVVAGQTMAMDESDPFSEGWGIEKRGPENDQLLFGVQNNTCESMPIRLAMDIMDKNFSPFKTTEIGDLSKVVQPNSYLSFMKSECEFMAWAINAFNTSDEPPLNCNFNIMVFFNMHNLVMDKGNRLFRDPRGSQMLSFGLFENRFPLGERFVISEEPGQDGKPNRFKVDLEEVRES